MIPARVPDVTFKTRVLNESLGGPNPYEWKDVTSKEVFAGKRIVVVGLPVAFTPACSETHLPGYERLHDDFGRLGVDRIVCVSVNDAFVMFQWAKSRPDYQACSAALKTSSACGFVPQAARTSRVRIARRSNRRLNRYCA